MEVGLSYNQDYLIHLNFPIFHPDHKFRKIKMIRKITKSSIDGHVISLKYSYLPEGVGHIIYIQIYESRLVGEYLFYSIVLNILILCSCLVFVSFSLHLFLNLCFF